MKRCMVLLLFVALGLALVPSHSLAQPPTKKYTTCKAVWKKYPNGLAASKYFADRAVSLGYKRPRINANDYFDSPQLIRDYMICPVARPDVVPSPPTLTATFASSTGLTITGIWRPPANAGMKAVYDVYLDGVKIDEGLTLTSYTWRNLAPATTYTIGVVTRNSAGSSPLATATTRTISAEQAANPGRVKVTYKGTGTVSVTMQSTSGTQQFANVTDPVFEFWFAPGSFVYLSVQNQNDAGSVSCSITSNGRTVSTNVSSGAYVIATCSGRS
jgi:hypothetical protein